ncbi:MAG: ABC transporter permease [Calditrichaceae bacterium]|nr:ABC transporter permease [Calditrichia bacterium]NUQ44188.1 ABC transporter permease [Calditrichaceae bacterium]
MLKRDVNNISFTVGPALAFLGVFFLAPLLIILVYSLLSRGAYGEIEFTFSLKNYANLLDPLYLSILLRSLKLALLTTLFSLLIGYPVALSISQMVGKRQFIFLMLVIIPSWMNLLIKNYAWMVILRRQGLLNTALLAAGVIDEPLSLMFNEPAVLVGLVHTYLPFMALPIYAALERLDRRLIEAARDLGANRWQTLRRIIFPQSIAGVLVGSILVFVPALGAFITPDLLGGANSLMVGNLIQNQFFQARDWPFGSALAICLMSLVLLALLLYARFAGRVGEERVL